MYGLYDKDGILRYVNSDRGACLAYAELFELSSKNYSLMPIHETKKDNEDINFDQNQARNNS